MAETMKTSIKGGGFLLEEVEASDVFTPEEFTEEHRMIAKTTEDFVHGEVVPVIDRIENHEFDVSRELLTKAGELGLLGSDIPEKYEGLSLDKISSTLITEKFSPAGGFSLSHGAHVGIGTLPIVFFGNEEQKKKYLPDLASGRKIAAYALTEPSSGSDALGAKTTAVLNDEGTHYILNGEKQWITNSAFADVFVVYAQIDGEKFTAFIVEREYDGVSTGPEEKKMGIKGSSTRTLLLEDVKVPKEHVLGEIGRGHIIAFNILNIGRYKLGVGCLGGSKRAIELAASYATERKQFNTPIARFTTIQEKLGSMAAKTYALESSIYRTGGLFEEQLGGLTEEEQEDGSKIAKGIAEYAIECSLNKVYGSETLDFCTDEAVQIYGGYGFMAEYEVERAYRDSRINRIFEGTNEINRLLVPGTLIRKTMKGELPFLDKANGLQEELMSFMPEEPGDEPLAKEKYLLENAKKIFLMGTGSAMQKYGEKIEDEQELLLNTADIVSEIYNMEAAIARTEKAIGQHGVEKEAMKLLLTQVICEEGLQNIEADAKESLIHMEEGDNLRTMLSMLRKLTRRTPVNVIAAKRDIAERIIDKKKYEV
ncbi:alkylation response protein AidB-like acyl-CoA dehydrogenase [Geomicrobium halophilum]|uniref:Alkylation response protein AidB-like acyl-CoA dehydrogenase n=1 Tax=Geomicrobium halophilum TaxID=549000 RepID=A0A841PVC7_9BACL|nr:acyl-CoA dehydrogenase family protein [Geomicrobium halophilum]MBB6450261.1 alkylation response protein AidB-like acyl-CoA dehydrogenase [Geomicrobium halophilum]